MPGIQHYTHKYKNYGYIVRIANTTYSSYSNSTVRANNNQYNVFELLRFRIVLNSSLDTVSSTITGPYFDTICIELLTNV